jgi:hypothetical protein
MDWWSSARVFESRIVRDSRADPGTGTVDRNARGITEAFGAAVLLGKLEVDRLRGIAIKRDNWVLEMICRAR